MIYHGQQITARKLLLNNTFHCRSYGRPPKTVKLKANFVRLSEGMLVDVSSMETYTTASSLHKQPFFHIYWTDCQVRKTSYLRIYKFGLWQVSSIQ